MNTHLVLGAIVIITLATTVGVTPIVLQLLSANAFITRTAEMAPIATSGDNVYIVWFTDGKKEVMFRASNDSGQTFGDKINLSNTTDSNSAHADIAASGDKVYVSFHDNKTGNVDTYVRASTDGGQTFGDIISINGTGSLPQESKMVSIPGMDILQNSEENTQIAASGDNVYVVSWDKKGGNWEVFLARGINNGETFEDTINLSNSSNALSDRALLVADGDNVYVSWWERNQTANEPVMSVSNDNGKTFGPTLKLASNGTIG